MRLWTIAALGILSINCGGTPDGGEAPSRPGASGPAPATDDGAAAPDAPLCCVTTAATCMGNASLSCSESSAWGCVINDAGQFLECGKCLTIGQPCGTGLSLAEATGDPAQSGVPYCGGVIGVCPTK